MGNSRQMMYGIKWVLVNVPKPVFLCMVLCLDLQICGKIVVPQKR